MRINHEKDCEMERLPGVRRVTLDLGPFPHEEGEQFARAVNNYRYRDEHIIAAFETFAGRMRTRALVRLIGESFARAGWRVETS